MIRYISTTFICAAGLACLTGCAKPAMTLVEDPKGGVSIVAAEEKETVFLLNGFETPTENGKHDFRPESGPTLIEIEYEDNLFLYTVPVIMNPPEIDGVEDPLWEDIPSGWINTGDGDLRYKFGFIPDFGSGTLYGIFTLTGDASRFEMELTDRFWDYPPPESFRTTEKLDMTPRTSGGSWTVEKRFEMPAGFIVDDGRLQKLELKAFRNGKEYQISGRNFLYFKSR